MRTEQVTVYRFSELSFERQMLAINTTIYASLSEEIFEVLEFKNTKAMDNWFTSILLGLRAIEHKSNVLTEEEMDKIISLIVEAEKIPDIDWSLIGPHKITPLKTVEELPKASDRAPMHIVYSRFTPKMLLGFAKADMTGAKERLMALVKFFATTASAKFEREEVEFFEDGRMFCNSITKH